MTTCQQRFVVSPGQSLSTYPDPGSSQRCRVLRLDDTWTGAQVTVTVTADVTTLDEFYGWVVDQLSGLAPL